MDAGPDQYNVVATKVIGEIGEKPTNNIPIGHTAIISTIYINKKNGNLTIQPSKKTETTITTTTTTVAAANYFNENHVGMGNSLNFSLKEKDDHYLNDRNNEKNKKVYKMYVFGGYCAGKYLDDLLCYEVESKKWEKISQEYQTNILEQTLSVPRPRVWHSMTKISEHRFVVFGGESTNKSRFNDMLEYNILENKWHKIDYNNNHDEIPMNRCAHSAVLRNHESLVIFGGAGDVLYNDVFQFDFAKRKWINLSAVSEVNRDHNAQYINGNMTGVTSDNTNTISDNKSSEDHGKNHKKKLISCRFSHSAVMRQTCDKMIVFGGKGTTSRLNDLWEFDFETYTWSEVTPLTNIKPCERSLHSAEIIVTRDHREMMIIFGGFSGTKNLSDMYAFDFEAGIWIQYTISGNIPTPRSNHSLAFIASQQKFILFGGENAGSFVNSMYELQLPDKKENPYQQESIKSFSTLLYRTKPFTDVDIKVLSEDGDSDNDYTLFDCHSFLIIQSDLIRELLMEEYNKRTKLQKKGEEPSGRIHIVLPDQIKSTVFQLILDYLYARVSTLDQRIMTPLAIQIVKACDILKLRVMNDYILTELEKRFNKENVLEIVQHAFIEKQSDILGRCINYICSHINEVTGNPEFIKLDKELMILIIQSTHKLFPSTSIPYFRQLDSLPLVNFSRHLQALRQYHHDIGSDLNKLDDESVKKNAEIIPATCDIKLVSNDGIVFFCHRAILSCRCHFFSSLFSGKYFESLHRTITLDELNGNVTSIILDYLYGLPISSFISPNSISSTVLPLCTSSNNSENIELKPKSAYVMNALGNCAIADLMDLLVASNMLLLNQLQEQCISAIENRLDCENVKQVLDFCEGIQLSETIGALRYLRQRCLKILLS